MNIAQRTTQTPDEIRQERALYERSIGGVGAAVIGNCAAGLGVAFIAGVICHWLNVDGYTMARITISTWLVAWGAIMALWFSQDEIAVVRAQHEVKQLNAALDHAEDTIEALQADLATTKHDNALLSFRIQELERNRNFTPATAPESPAYRDARELIRAWAKTGDHPSRRKMGWTDTRHSAAMWVLQQRQIVTVGKGNTVTWIAPDAATALSMLASNQPLPLDWPGGATSTGQSTEGDEP